VFYLASPLWANSEICPINIPKTFSSKSSKKASVYSDLIFTLLQSGWVLQVYYFLSPLKSYRCLEVNIYFICDFHADEHSRPLLGFRTQKTNNFTSYLPFSFGLPLVWPLQIEEARKPSHHVKVAVHEEGPTLPNLAEEAFREFLYCSHVILTTHTATPRARNAQHFNEWWYPLLSALKFIL
jgi:hypothetical protein